MRQLLRVGVSVVLDLFAVIGAYLLAVFFRVGGRLETARPEEAGVTALLAAAGYVGGHALIGAYRDGWPEEARTLGLLVLPAAIVAGVIALLNIVSDLHPIPTGAILPAAV